MFSTILAPVDGSEQSEKALKQAVELAKLCGAKLLILTVYRHHSMLEASLSMVRGRGDHVTPDDALRENATSIADAARKIATEGGLTDVRAFVRSGQPARAIVEFAEKYEADLIVVGSRGNGSFDEYLLGSVSHKVTGTAKAPVLVV
jgi:nucleotide-binding universal stress UspA family protein